HSPTSHRLFAPSHSEPIPPTRTERRLQGYLPLLIHFFSYLPLLLASNVHVTRGPLDDQIGMLAHERLQQMAIPADGLRRLQRRRDVLGAQVLPRHCTALRT